MAYRNKEDCLREAKRLGLDVEGMDWKQLQKTVSDAIKREELGMEPTQVTTALYESKPKKQKAKSKADEDMERLMEFYGTSIMMAPELAPERYRLVKYDEVLGNEVEVEERKFDINRETDQVYDMSGGEVNHDNQIDTYHDYTTGTYRIKERNQRKVIGMASVPKEQPGIGFRPGYDWLPVCSFKNKHGYFWKHPFYPNVSDLLKQAGDEYYQKYRKVFKDAPNVWYSCGHLVCDPYLVNKVLMEISEDAKQKRDMALAREKAVLNQW